MFEPILVNRAVTTWLSTCATSRVMEARIQARTPMVLSARLDGLASVEQLAMAPSSIRRSNRSAPTSLEMSMFDMLVGTLAGGFETGGGGATHPVKSNATGVIQFTNIVGDNFNVAIAASTVMARSQTEQRFHC